jgi:hypothetical protein
MKKALWIVAAAVALLVVLAAMGIAAFLLWGLPDAIGTVTVNGEVLDLHGAHAGHWLLATLGVLLALLVLLVIVPTLLLLALAVPLTLAGFGLVTAALVVGLVLSPLWLLIWWLWKRNHKPGTIAR